MDILFGTLACIFGTIVGSFLNVVIYRFNTGRTVGGHSHCMSCGTRLRSYELVPVVSYLLLRARCSHCGAFIPPRYMVVELLTGLMFLLSWQLYQRDLGMLGLHFVLVSVLMVIVVYDIRHTIIPDRLVIVLGILAVCIAFWRAIPEGHWLGLVFDLIGGLVAGLFFFGLWYGSKGRWIGLGDAKLALPLGVITGAATTFSMIVFAFWIGAVISLVLIGVQYLLREGKTRLPFLSLPITMKSEVPFAPFLILGFLCTHFFHVDIFSLALILWP